jgi:hypothetical protein
MAASRCRWPGRQTGKAACFRSRCLRVRLPPGPLVVMSRTTRPRGAARSARLAVDEEIRGSNPLGGAGLERNGSRHGTRTGMAARLKPWCPVGSTPTRASPSGTGWNASAGHWRAQVAVTHPPFGVLQVQLLPGALLLSEGSGPLVYRQGHRPLKPERRVRFPHGLLSGFSMRPDCGGAGARPSLISSVGWVRLPDPLLSATAG